LLPLPFDATRKPARRAGFFMRAACYRARIATARSPVPDPSPMSQPENDLAVLLRTMQPELHRGAFAFVTLPADAEISLSEAIATFREAEGMTVVVDEETAARRGWPVLFRAAWITLTVHSDLAAVGLTAAFARALGAAGISCNVMAAAYHDHIFVPFDDGPRALDALVALQRDAMRG